MMANKKQIFKRALVRLGEIAIDEIATATLEFQASNTLESLHANWVARGYIRWELDDIPLELEDSVTSVLAFSMADDFSVPSERYQRLAAASARGSRNIIIYNEPNYVSQPAEFF